MAFFTMNPSVSSPYLITEWGKCKYLFMFTFCGWLNLAVLGLTFLGPGRTVDFMGYNIPENEVPMSLLVDPKTAQMFTTMSVLVVVANPFLTLLAWIVVPLNCLYRYEDSHLRGGIVLFFYGFLIAVMVAVVILGERVASAKPAFDEVLSRFPDLTLVEAQQKYNARMHGLRVGLAINLSLCLIISLPQIVLVYLATLIPSRMKVPRPYEPTVQNSGVKQRQEEVPLLFSVTDNSSPVSGALEDLFQKHEARWMESRTREEVAIHESLATDRTADNRSNDTEENNINQTADNTSSDMEENNISHVAENTYINSTADNTPEFTSGEEVVVSSLPRFESYQSYLKNSLPTRIWHAQWLSLAYALIVTLPDILLMSSAFRSESSCNGQCIIETTGTYPWLVVFLLGYQLSRYHRGQKQRSWAMSMLLHLLIVAQCLCSIYSFAAYVLFLINFSHSGLVHLGVSGSTAGAAITEVAGFFIKLSLGSIIFLCFLWNMWAYIVIYPLGLW